MYLYGYRQYQPHALSINNYNYVLYIDLFFNLCLYFVILHIKTYNKDIIIIIIISLSLTLTNIQ